MEITAGAADQAETYFAHMAEEFIKLRRIQDEAELEALFAGLYENIDYGMEQIRFADSVFRAFDEKGLLDQLYARLDALKQRMEAEINVVTHKKAQIAQRQQTTQWFNQATGHVNLAVKGLDTLLSIANHQFERLQSDLSSTLEMGFKSTAIILIVLLALATQNFSAMRRAIHRKMDDLAKLNQIGVHLAGARDQATALHEVLQAMALKMGIEQGSVYLFNREHELEAKAFLPPKVIAAENQPIRFTLGQGIMGKAAQSKQVVFVPDTSRERDYVSAQSEDKPRAILCVPLLDKDLLIGMMNFSGDTKSVHFADSDYEFVSSAALSLVTTIKNIRMVELIEEHNRNLEKKVEERTAALKQKNEDIANMLSNMNQGLFTITQGGLIHPEYAAYLETIFETEHIADRHFMDLLFQHASASEDAKDQVETAVESIVGEDAMAYEFNSHLLINELTLNFPAKPDKLIELDWNPIIDECDNVTKLMVTVRDVTALRALQAEAEGQRQELLIIGEILAVDAGKFEEFIEGSTQFIDRCRRIIEQTNAKDAERLAELFRNIHTVKGNARTYGLKKVTETVHLIENTYDSLRKDERVQWQPDQLLSELHRAEDVIAHYRKVFQEKLGRGGEAGILKLHPPQVANLMARIDALKGLELAPPMNAMVKDTYRALVANDAQPISQVIGGVIESVQSLAEELGKPQPQIEIDDGPVLIRHQANSVLNNIFMHVFRNAMDHGIEKPAERESKGKPAPGRISLTTEVDGPVTRLIIRDDGRGIALTKIYEKAIEKGFYAAGTPRPAAREIANLIFASGFSTAEQVTEVSGRGVGMDAVRSFLLAEGGNIEVVLDPGAENADFRGFSTILTIPQSFYMEPPTFALAS
jgi:putative methionine-R-sulfoxide reductase with GAF domain/HPt (histidine-containing phosphotransfer) domain-containing protein